MAGWNKANQIAKLHETEAVDFFNNFTENNTFVNLYLMITN
jgi:hypothetical protein